MKIIKNQIKIYNDFTKQDQTNIKLLVKMFALFSICTLAVFIIGYIAQITL